ncbi:acyl transferase/acyl hydrolase/lysophospholipase [Zopfochytrium polystomum]|nr:acyl transferase/acyl hydrolase/lysophospholipase [Zopfochytrium polystomum]
MVYLLRSGLLRNLGGLNDPRLFEESYTGTKKLIEEYQAEVVAQLKLLSETDGLQASTRLEFINDTRQSFGSTALILQGGATFGLYHLGVVKCLIEHGLLPRIISGSSVGALIAALVCIHPDNEMDGIFLPGGIDLLAFTKKAKKGTVRRKITRFLKHGEDVKVLEDCVRANVGDITFQEAYLLTKRVLNITVSTTRKHELPRLLNYLTAPNVLIWSAACASASMTGLYQSVELLAKDKNGNIFSWNPQRTPINHNSHPKHNKPCSSESPEARLAELFNVNHLIVSQANPYIAPFLKRAPQEPREELLMKALSFVYGEIKHRLDQIGLLPSLLQPILVESLKGHVTITPQLSPNVSCMLSHEWIMSAPKDFYTLLSNPTYATLSYWITKGEKSTWPFLSMIRNRTVIEIALDEAARKLKRLDQERALGNRSHTAEKSRTRSIH